MTERPIYATMDRVSSVERSRRREYSGQFKAAVLERLPTQRARLRLALVALAQ